jgi:hypothetical protein
MGNSEPYETHFEDPAKLYRSCLKEYGRCISKVYIDKNGKSVPVGWVFLKRQEYEDSRKRPSETYLHETWVTLHSGPPTRKTTYHYINPEANTDG